MTYAIVPALRHAPDLAGAVRAAAGRGQLRPGLRPPLGKRGLLAGMSMTEKQGGSDVRANTTTAAAQPGTAATCITGHKWFTSAPMGDLFMVLAQIPGTGLSCFLLPRVLPDGTRNGDAPDAAEGQARQPVERLRRGRVRERDGVAGRRGGPRRPDDHRHGQLDPA